MKQASNVSFTSVFHHFTQFGLRFPIKNAKFFVVKVLCNPKRKREKKHGWILNGEEKEHGEFSEGEKGRS